MDNRTGDVTPRLETEIQDFVLERQIRKVSARTLQWHEHCLAKFRDYCYQHDVTSSQQITANLLRRFVLMLEASGHNPGGLANIYRSVKAFLNWCELEYDNRGWQNPARKVRVSTKPPEPLDPISLSNFQKMLNACERKTLIGERDRSVLLMLLDTGIRKAEITALTTKDLDLKSGSVLIRSGKGGKTRTVFLGATTRRTLIAYLRHRESFLDYLERSHNARIADSLWINASDGRKLNKDGISQILRRRSSDAGIPDQTPHAFRRAFAVNALRNGMNIIALQRLLGHSDLSVINRYVKLLKDDLQVAHEQYGVVDNL